MTPPNKASLHKLILANRNRMQRLGLAGRDDLRFLHQLSQSPMEQVALKFANKLNRILDGFEFHQSMHMHEWVPQLDPDTSIEIGKTVGQGLPYRIGINDLTTHMAVCGSIGSGKTNLIARIMSALLGHVKTLVLDHKDESLRLVGMTGNAAYLPIGKQRWNCLAGTGNQKDYIRFICSQLAKLMGLLPVTANAVQAKMLALCSDRNHLPAISDLAAIFLALVKREPRSSLYTASNGFSDLAVNMGKSATVRQGAWPFDDYLLSVVPLKDCPTAFEYFHVALLFRQLMDRATLNGHTTDLRRLVVFDEGRGFFGKELESGTASGRVNLQVDILTKTRSYGIGTIIGTQSITGIQQAVIDNAQIFAALRTNSEQEARACCRRLGLDESRYMELINMEVGTAWVVSPKCRQPVKIKIPFCDLGDYPGENEIARRMKPLWDSWDAQAVFAPSKSETDETIDFREILGEKISAPETASEPDKPAAAPFDSTDHPPHQTSADPLILSEYFALLRSCEANPEFGATAHYKALGWSAGRGHRVKESLLDLNWIEAVRIPSPKGGRPKETLQLTPKGKAALK